MFYEPVQAERYFERDRRYNEITWSAFAEVVDAFDRRIRGWYMEPIELLMERGTRKWSKCLVRWLIGRQDGGHYSFTVMAMTCALIDTLSQYRYGLLASDGPQFVKFVNSHLPSYSGVLPVSLRHYDNKFSPNGKPLRGYAEVLWNGFRCGILHQTHAPLYCGVVPGNEPPSVEATNHAKYAAGAGASFAGSDCPVVVIRPEHLYGEVTAFFTGYLRDLKDKALQHNPLRDDFKKKFADSFGVDLAASVL